MSELKATIDVQPVKTLLSILSKLSEEAIYTWTPEGLRIRVVCAQRFKLADIWLKPEAFREYECPETIKLGVVNERLKDIIKTLTSKETVDFSYQDGKLVLAANGLRRVVKLLRLEYMNEVEQLPDFSYSYSLTTISKDIRDYLKALGKTMAFDAILRNNESGNSELIWRSKNDEEPIEWKPVLSSLDSDSEDSEEQRVLTASGFSATTYTTEEVLATLGATLRKQPVTLQGGQDLPLRAEWTPHDGFRVIAMVANRS